MERKDFVMLEEEQFEKMKKIGVGNTAEVFLLNENLIVKLFKEYITFEYAEKEFKKATKLQAELDCVPRAHTMVKLRGRYGIVYDRVVGKDMLDIMTHNLGHLNENVRPFVYYQNKINGLRIDMGLGVKEKLSADILTSKNLSEAERDRVIDYIDKLPNGRGLCHMDYHPGNILLKDDSKTPLKPAIIDWQTAANGPASADIAKTYYLIRFGKVPYLSFYIRGIRDVLGRVVAKKYMESQRKISGAEFGDIKPWLMPVAASRLSDKLTVAETKNATKIVKDGLKNL